MAFSELDKQIQAWLENIGYKKSSLPQEKAIPEILEGNDVLLIAPTGHGKTLAAILPIFSRLLEEKDSEGIKVIYVTPLKSLNRDIFGRVVKLASEIGIDVDIRHGDTPQRIRAQQLADPADMLITTPETLQAILTGKKFREHLKSVRYVILDEIHEICENKRGSQLMVALERLKRLSCKFQRIGLSATVGDSVKIGNFLSPGNCKVVNALEEKEYEFKVERPNPEQQDFALAKELPTFPSVAYCLRRIYELVESNKSTIIFVNTRETAETLGIKLKKWKPELKIGVHHSSLSKDVRIDVEEKFRSGELKGIIATSSLELGIDIGSVELVIQYGSPRMASKLIQRVGRSGHGIGRISKGIVLCNSIDDYLEAFAIKQKADENWIEHPRIPEKPYDVLAHQIAGICLDFSRDGKNATESEMFEIVKKAYPFRNLSREDISRIIEILEDVGLLGRWKDGFYLKRRGLLYYFENLSTIPSEKNYLVISSELNKRIGVLHQGFVAQHARKGAVFIMRGEPWRIVEVEQDKINVVSAGSEDGAVPSWEGELIPVPEEIARLSGDLREEISAVEMDVQKKEFVLPTSSKMYLESFENYVIIHSCFGSRINQTLGKVIAAVISSKIGSSISVRTDAYRVILRMPEIFGQETVVESLENLNPKWIDDLLRKSLKNSSLFEYRFYHIAKRFGVIGRTAEFSRSIISKVIEVYNNTPLFDETMNELFREKLDVDGTVSLLESIKKGEIKFVFSGGYELSPLGAEGLSYRGGSIVKPRGEPKEIYEMIKKRMLKRKFWFACARCGSSMGIFSSQNTSDEIKCNSCSSRHIGFCPAKETEVVRNVLRKKFSGKELSEDESKVMNKFLQTADMFLDYGSKAVFVLSGYGIGPTTGKRILNKSFKTEDELLKEILYWEKKFIETKMFW